MPKVDISMVPLRTGEGAAFLKGTGNGHHLTNQSSNTAVLIVEMNEEPGRSFRMVPREAWSVENNLSIANMDFSDFAYNVDKDGVFRGFPTYDVA
jgi:hypothetical protein